MKKARKKLKLSSETLRSLDGSDLGRVAGADTRVGCSKQLCSAESYCGQCATFGVTDCYGGCTNGCDTEMNGCISEATLCTCPC
jgi:hypothetical protein